MNCVFFQPLGVEKSRHYDGAYFATTILECESTIEGERHMPYSRTATAVSTSLHERFSTLHGDARLQLESALNLHSQLLEKFGALNDVLLWKLAKATSEQITDASRCVSQVSSLEALASCVGWNLSHGGEGNYPMLDDSGECLSTFNEHHWAALRFEQLVLAQKAYCAQSGSESSSPVIYDLSEFARI
jgi:hypothetical protein